MTNNSKYIRFDWAIKCILRDTANKKVLEGLISVLIKEPVTITEILESENNKIRLEDKGNRVDVKAKTQDGEIIIVEVQLSKEIDFFQRILFGTAAAINDQIGIGLDYKVIKKVYSINVLYFDFGTGDDYAYHGYMEFHGMTKEDSVLQFNNEKEETFVHKGTKPVTPHNKVFPEYFLLRVNQFNEVAKTPIEEWMAYLKDGIINDDTTDPGLQEAREKLTFMKMSEAEQKAYREYMVSVHAAKDVIDTAKKEGFNHGWDLGHDEGVHEGREKGREEGRKEGLKLGEENKAKAIARNMKAKGFSIADIADMTGLAAEEIAQM